VVDARWWFGVMMPSVDNVGRYFPLLVAQAGHAPMDDASFDRIEHWYADVSDALLDTLVAGASLDRFEDALLRAGMAGDASNLAVPIDESQWPDRATYRLAGGLRLGDAMQGIAFRDSLQKYRGCTLWSPVRASAGGVRVSVAVGLPPPESFVQLLQGEW
jgi:type VI secretion system protein ImpM